MDNRDTFAEIIELIYGTVSKPDTWSDVLSRISDFSDSTHSFLTERKGVHGEPISFYEDGFSHNYFRKYGEYFYQVDVWSQNLAKYKTSQFHESHKVCDDKFFLNSEIYCDFAKPEGIRHSLGLFLGDPHSDLTTEMAFMRSNGQSHYDQETVKGINRFIPHIQQVQNLTRRLYKTELHSQNLENVLDDLDEAVYLCNKELKIEYLNQRGRQLLNRSKLFSGRKESLLLREKRDAEHLKTLVFEAVNIKSETNLFVKRHLLLSDGQQPYLVSISPWNRKIMALFGEQSEFGVKLSFLPVDTRKLPNKEDLARIYKITITEAEIVKLLCGGVSISDIAVKRGTTLQTTRQQFKSCMQKLGCKRQVEVAIKVLGQCLI